MAYVAGDTLADGRHLRQLVGKKGFAAGGLCQAFEHTQVPFLIFRLEYTYGVDDGARLPGQCHDFS